MFQKWLMTSLTTPLCDTNEVSSWDNRPFSAVWPEAQQNTNKVANSTIAIKKKKPKRSRTAFTTNQLSTLEKVFASSKFIGAIKRKELADHLNIPDKTIKIWFQNRRMKEKHSASSDTSVDSSSNASSPPIKQDPSNYDEKAESLSSVYSAQFEGNIAMPQYQSAFIPCVNYSQFQGHPTNMPQNFSWYDNSYYPAQYPYADYNTNQYSQQDHLYNIHEFI